MKIMTGSGYSPPSAGGSRSGNFDAVTLETPDINASQISLITGPKLAEEFFPILQRGFGEMAMVPCTIKDLLCDQFGLSYDYVSGRITTIFLDGKATDSIDEAIVKERSTIALSAAMPGVVGATMRRGSFYASMRSAITSTDMGKAGASREGMICIKLFNLLLTDLGPEFLKKGILMTPSALTDFFSQKKEIFWQGCKGTLINGKPVATAYLKHAVFYSDCEIIKLSIEFQYD